MRLSVLSVGSLLLGRTTTSATLDMRNIAHVTGKTLMKSQKTLIVSVM